MKSIKEKAEEAKRNTHPLFESIRESDGKPVSIYDQDDMISMFEAGANYVLNIIEQALTPQKCFTDIGIDVSPEALIKTALQTIEALKKK